MLRLALVVGRLKLSAQARASILMRRLLGWAEGQGSCVRRERGGGRAWERFAGWLLTFGPGSVRWRLKLYGAWARMGCLESEMRWDKANSALQLSDSHELKFSFMRGYLYTWSSSYNLDGLESLEERDSFGYDRLGSLGQIKMCCVTSYIFRGIIMVVSVIYRSEASRAKRDLTPIHSTECDMMPFPDATQCNRQSSRRCPPDHNATLC